MCVRNTLPLKVCSENECFRIFLRAELFKQKLGEQPASLEREKMNILGLSPFFHPEWLTCYCIHICSETCWISQHVLYYFRFSASVACSFWRLNKLFETITCLEQWKTVRCKTCAPICITDKTRIKTHDYAKAQCFLVLT